MTAPSKPYELSESAKEAMDRVFENASGAEQNPDAYVDDGAVERLEIEANWNKRFQRWED